MDKTEVWSRLVAEKRYSTLFAVFLAMGLYGIFGLLDRYIFPSVAATILPIRAVVVGSLVLLVACMLFAPAFYQKRSQILLSICMLAGGLGIILMNPIIADLPHSGSYYAGLIMVIAFMCVLVPLRFYYALALCLVFLFSYNFSLLYHDIPTSIAVSNNFFLVGSSIICGLSNFDHERQVYRRFEHERLIEQQKKDIETQKLRADNLLRQILPDPIATRLMDGTHTIADGYADVTVLFADLAGFTEFSSTVSPRSLVRLLNEIFSAFDDVAQRCGVEKIKTIGDAYMAACGLPDEVDDHAERMVRMAIGMRAEMARIRAEFPEHALDIRIGIHTGPCVAGVIGRQRFIYDLWGDTVNLASRMESTGITGQIQVSETTWLRTRNTFSYEPRGEVHAKGKGTIKAYLLKV